MVRHALRPFLLGLVAVAGFGCGEKIAREERPVEALGQRLFNGRDLVGWTTWLRGTGRTDPRAVFSVDDGAIRISGEGYGYLATEQTYRNYALSLEYRWGTQAGLDRGERRGKALDSGVFVHATGPDGNSHDGDGAFMAGIEWNVFEGATGDLLLIRGDAADGSLIAPRLSVEARELRDGDGFPFWRAGGDLVKLERWGRVNWFGKSTEWRDVRGFRGPNDVEKPVGEWNHLELTCRGEVIEARLNGVLVNRASGVGPHEGRILLQCEGAEVWFRGLVLEPATGG